MTTPQNPADVKASEPAGSQPNNPPKATSVPLDLDALLQHGMMPMYSALFPLVASMNFAAAIDNAIEVGDYDSARRACANLTEGTMRSFIYAGARLGLTPEQTQLIFDRIEKDFHASLKPAAPDTAT